MTLGVIDRVTAVPPAPATEGARAQPGRRSARPPVPPPTPASAALGTGLTVLSVLLLAFVLEVTLLGAVRHAREQRLAYDVLRNDLAQGIAPIGQTDPTGALVAPGRPVALLTIPAIGVREVVFEGTSGSILAGGPGHRRDTPYPGQAGASAIFGRQAGYGGPFGRIDELVKGQEIAVATGQGTHLYVVTGVRREGDPTRVIQEGEARLVLTTATGTPYLPESVVSVDARLVSEVKPAPGTVLSSASLAAPENAMEGDDSVVLPLFLWAQLLLLVSVAMVWMRSAWGRWQTWVVAVPVLAYPCVQVAHNAAQLLPNLL